MAEKTVPVRSVVLPESFEARTRVARGGGYATKLVQSLFDDTQRNSKAARVIPVTDGDGNILDFTTDADSLFQKRSKSLRGIYLKAAEGLKLRLSTGFVLNGKAGTQKIASEDVTGVLLYNARIREPAAKPQGTQPTPVTGKTQGPQKK